MTIEYNLVKLYNIYNQSLNEDEPTLVFEIRQGRGIFTFLMFFQKRILNQKISCLSILEIQMYLLQ